MKKQGELVELRFYLEATKRGHVVSKPFGDSAPYDFILDANNNLFRVQVKSTAVLDTNNRASRYKINASKGSNPKIPYTAEEIDLLAAYVIPCDIWYLIPIEALNGGMILSLFPHRIVENGRGVYEKYRSEWGF